MSACLNGAPFVTATKKKFSLALVFMACENEDSPSIVGSKSRFPTDGSCPAALAASPGLMLQLTVQFPVASRVMIVVTASPGYTTPLHPVSISFFFFTCQTISGSRSSLLMPAVRFAAGLISHNDY